MNEYIRRDMTGRVCVVTGANSGVGFEAARALARDGADVVMVCRDPGRGETARQTIAEEVGIEPRLVLADFARLASVRDAAAEISAACDRVDVLANNAGMIASERILTEDGNELTFQVNHLAHFLLTSLLGERLHAAPEARVITVSSGAHFRTFLGVDLDDPSLERGWSPFKAYAQSKLANVLFAYGLQERLEGTSVTSNAMHPGALDTDFGSEGWGVFGRAWDLLRPFLRTAEQGAATLLYLAEALEVQGLGGGYFFECEPRASSPASHSTDQRERLWALSDELTSDA